MTLLNASALFAACGLLVPIIIHLHRKRKAKVIEWPAMQFLTNTMASRRRGLALENLLLLFVRCLVIMLFVLAMAQPLLPSGGSLPLIASFVLMTGGLVGIAVAVIRAFKRRTRVASFVAAALLLAGAAATLQLDPEDFTSPTENCDLVIVIDETSSMLMGSGNDEEQQRSSFTDAVDEALLLVDQLSGSSTVSIIRCGPVVETIDGSPFRDLPAARKLLTELQPTGGGASTSDAIDQAVALAKKGPNTRKQVVLFTDDQLRTWESFEESQALATVREDQPTGASPGSRQVETGASARRLMDSENDNRLHLAVHLAKLPDHAANISIVSTRVESPVPAVGQSLMIEAEVRNHSAAAVANVDVQLSIDGKRVTAQTVDVLPPATTTTVRFSHTFENAGEHVVTTQTEYPDAMLDDNRHDTVVSVVPFVSVLLVNGNEFAKPGDQSATFLQLSLDPMSRIDVREDAVVGRPMRVQSISVSELAQLIRSESRQDFRPKLLASFATEAYDLVVLSDVPQLPADTAAHLSRYVERGGGLWIIPDQQANADFYNGWKVEESETVLLPATLLDHQHVDARDLADNAAQTGIDLQATGSGLISDLIRTGEHDLTEVVVSGYREVALRDSAVAALKLTNGDPLFVEQAVGEGRVLLQTIALGRQESNLPQRVCFPVLMHLWSYYLADCRGDDSNFEPCPELSVPVSFDDLADADVDSLLLTDPAGEEQVVKVVRHSRNSFAQISRAGRPGIYTLNSQSTTNRSQSFTIARDDRESDLSVISQEKLNSLQETHGIQWLNDVEQLRIAGVAELTEHEIAPHLLLVVLCLIAVESLLAAWIRRRRMVTSTPPVATVARRWKPTPHALASVATDKQSAAALVGGAE